MALDWLRPSLCVAGVALGDMDRALCVAGVALGDIDLHFAWQVWHLWHWIGSGGALGCQLTPLSPRLLAWQVWHLVTSTFTLCGRRGTWRHRSSLCVAGMSLGDIDLHFAWQAWHFWHWIGSGGALGSQLTPLLPRLLAWQAWHLVTSTFTLCGRRGTWRHRSSLCVAGMALMALDWLWWRAWVPVDAVFAARVGVAHLVTSTFTLRGRRGTWRHRSSLCVAEVALMTLDWLWWRTWVSVDAVVAAAVGVVGVASGDIDVHFAWQAWHLATFSSALRLRGRRGPWLCVAGVALGDMDVHFASTVTLRGRRGTMRDVPFNVFWVLRSLWDRMRNMPRSQTTMTPKPPHITSQFRCTCYEVRQQQHFEPDASSMQARTVVIVCGDITATSVRAGCLSEQCFGHLIPASSVVICCLGAWLLAASMSFGLYVSCGTEVPHVTKSDSNDTTATTHHIKIRSTCHKVRQQ